MKRPKDHFANQPDRGPSAAGKGDFPRPVNHKVYRENFDAIFRKKKTKRA